MNIEDASKDDLILATLAALGGETIDVNERDLFLASWHAHPNAMRWVDTALPNPDTFTAALRRLDQRGYIRRIGKQQRQKRVRGAGRRRGALDAGRSGVVKARIAEDGLDRAGIDPAFVDEVRLLLPDPAAMQGLTDAALIVICIALRKADGRHVDEAALVELAFHKFPQQFAYRPRPEFPDVDAVRRAIAAARSAELVDEEFNLTATGAELAHERRADSAVRIDGSRSHEAGDLKFAARIERSPAYQSYAESGTLAVAKGDELYRMLRVPPTTDPRPVAAALAARTRTLRRVDRSQLADYLMAIARRHNPEVAALLEAADNYADSEGSDGAKTRSRGA